MGKPHLKYELAHWKMGNLVCGIDEVGRGCFAGPLVSAGVILKPNLSQKELIELMSLGINDSKLVPIKKRPEIIKLAQKYILGLSVQFIPVDIINEKGIGNANKLAFEKVAIELLYAHNNLHFLTDCFPISTVSPDFQTNMIRGDQISISIALASIIAKVKRDTYMEQLSSKFPEYGFEKHKGYGTKLHREAIKNYGIIEVHREDFCKNYLQAAGQAVPV